MSKRIEIGAFRFQSTLPRGSDGYVTVCDTNEDNISIHAPSRERPKSSGHSLKRFNISIHAPSRERLDSF